MSELLIECNSCFKNLSCTIGYFTERKKNRLVPLDGHAKILVQRTEDAFESIKDYLDVEVAIQLVVTETYWRLVDLVN